LTQALEKVSSSTESGRTTTKNAAAESDKLARAQRDLAFAESENAKALALLKNAQKEANDMTKLLIKRGDEEITMANLKSKSYNQLSAQYSMNKIVLNSMTAAERESTEAGKKFEAETKAIYEEMKRLQEVTGKHQLNVGNYGEAVKSVSAIIKENTQELVRMRMAGEQGSAAYNELLKKTGDLKDQLVDTTASISNMASDTTTLDTVMGGMAAAGGGLSAATGAMSLFGGANEEVAEAQKKLQSVIAITTGLTAIQNNLQKQSALMLGVSSIQSAALAKAEAYRRLIQLQGTKATIGATVAQKAFNMVAAMNPYVLLATALITVVGALVLFSSGTKDSEKQQESLGKQIDKTAESLRTLKNDSDFDIAFAEASGASREELRSLRLEAAKTRLGVADAMVELIQAQGGDAETVRKAADEAKAAWGDYIAVSRNNILEEQKQREADKAHAIKTKQDQWSKVKEIESKNSKDLLTLTRANEDLRLAMVEGGIEKERALLQVSYARQIEEIDTRLQTEKTLSEAQITELLEMQLILREKYASEIERVEEEYAAKRMQADATRIELQLASVEEGSQAEMDLRLALIEKKREIELNENAKLTEDLRQSEFDINAKYNAES
ncbi:MAG: hypothetical protein ACRCZY_01115, partial [Phocaeicola sp.]